MKLITGVEIGYFRSIYKQRLDKLDGLTVLFGRNDSGKSNVLRALNLFFNNETNPGQPFSFERDLCHARLAEAEEKRGARKFVYVKLEFQTPSSWTNSLGESFWVRKSWSITKQTEPNLESSIRDTKKHQYLTRFLNKIRFHYIPAIKDRRIFEELLGSIYSVVASQEEFRTSLETFSAELRARTSDLSAGLFDQLAVNSVISPPTELVDLFRSLDFETKSEKGDSYSLTLQRGDGIQVRHIPAILAFLSNRSSEDYHIWGFEEPENSLELANAIAESEVFCQYGDDANKQIFLTSHSPAFFALERSGVKRFFVSNRDMNGRKVSAIAGIPPDASQRPGDLMGETPHLPVISHYLKAADEHIKLLQQQESELTHLLAERDQSLLFVEGATDAVLISAAWEQFCGLPIPVAVESGAGTTKMEALGRDGAVLNRLSPNRKIYVVVDNDREGRELHKNGRLDGGSRWVRHNSNGTYWRRLPWTEDFKRVMRRLGVPQTHWPGSIENLFTGGLRQEAMADGAYGLSLTPHAELLEYFDRIAEVVADPLDPDRIYVFSPDPDLKEAFARWLVERSERDPATLEPLRHVVESLRDLVDQP